MGIFNELGKYVIEDDLFNTADSDTRDDGGDEEEEYTIRDFMKQGLADKKGVTQDDVDPDELAKGIAVEMEHTDNPVIAKKIALDHLAEIPDYYTRLMKMEKEAGRVFI